MLDWSEVLSNEAIDQYVDYVVDVERFYIHALRGINPHLVCEKTGENLEKVLRKNLHRIQKHTTDCDTVLRKGNLQRFYRLTVAFLSWVNAEKPHGINFRWNAETQRVDIEGAILP